MSILQKVSDPGRAGSIARRLRSKRFDFFLELLADVPEPIEILDIGGTEAFWEQMGFVDREGVRITVTNIVAPEPARHANFETRKADACDMSEFQTDQFDVVFSNSVIEHVGDLSACRAMAEEVMRVGKRYFVQTPNRHFPIDPHFPFPFFQFMPVTVRAWLLRVLPLAWVGRIRDPANARDIAQSVNLLGARDFRGLFPGCALYRERLVGLTKSFIAYGGWSASTPSS